MVRRARSEDLGAIFGLTKEFATSFVIEEMAFRSSFTAALVNAETYLAVSELDARITGYVLAFCHNTFYANGRVAWVEELMVDSSYRRQGVGRALMESVENWAINQGCTLVALATRRAAHFYEAMDYQASATYYRKLL